MVLLIVNGEKRSNADSRVRLALLWCTGGSEVRQASVWIELVKRA